MSPGLVVDDAALARAERFVEEEEGATNRYRGWLGATLTALAVVMSVFHLYAAYGIVPTHVLRPIHLGFVLFLVFLLFPATKGLRHQLRWWDIACAVISVGIMAYVLYWGDDFGERAAIPKLMDQVLGCVLVLLVLEATRRSTGWIMPAVVIAFLLYAAFGDRLPPPWTHRGYDISRLTGHLYMTLEGIFGVAIDVSSTLIILFTLYGAFLQFSGAGKFFIDFSFSAMGGKHSSAGRTVVLASFLLGGPSGSGVATTVTLGSVAYPMLARAGYEKNAAGGLLAAGGLGAIMSPPILGAAAFLIAEFLKISYLDVILMATIPTLLYYLGIFVMVELDARKYGMHEAAAIAREPLGRLTRQFGFHFLSLVAIIVFLLMGFSPILSVFWATVVALVVSFLHRDCALVPYDALRGRAPFWKSLWQSKLVRALEAGSVGMLNVGAICAAAGIIVGIVTLTGLGLKFSSIVLGYADAGARGLAEVLAVFGIAATAGLVAQLKLALTTFFTALIVWVVGLAVPITASYIICAVIAAPALIQMGVPDYAAHMFIFYYAVLSDVSPPTALSPFAAAAITGGDPYKTTLQSWKYTMPAFVVPFAFIFEASGRGLLLTGSIKGLATANWVDIAVVSATAAAGIAVLACALQRWMVRRTTLGESAALGLAGLLLVYPNQSCDVAGMAIFVAAFLVHRVRAARWRAISAEEGLAR
ncbi:MAG TPA: TRAP transporter fused permease subunit [Usitatibacter sp.]|nr:TRAP transporter fused permease subunit [Usitatibacter sp.]